MLQVDALQIRNLRIAFKAVKSLSKEPNTLEVRVYNLSGPSRALVQRKHALLTLMGGYGLVPELLFAGNTRHVTHVKRDADWITTIKSGDGEHFYRSMRVNLPFTKGTPIGTIIQSIAAVTGIGPGNLAAKLGQGDVTGLLTQTVKGMVASGRAVDVMEGLIRSLGYKLSIQDGQFLVLADREVTLEPPLLLTMQSGLIGSPEPGDDGIVKVRSLLQAGARPGRQVQIQSMTVNGVFKVQKAVHTGDTHGSDWYSDLEVKAVA